MLGRAAILLAAFAVAAAAQQARPLEVRIPSSTLGAADRPTVLVHGVLSGSRIRDLIDHAFPAQLHFRLELWQKNRWVDDQREAVEWDIVLEFDPASRRYTVRRYQLTWETLGTFNTLDDAARAIERPFPVRTIGRGRAGARNYYSATLDVRALSLSDLDALRRWLRGDFQPAVRGRRSPVSAVGSGLGTMVSRLIGGAKHTYYASSAIFLTG